MRHRLPTALAAFFACVAVSHACLRPEADERAIQWSDIIVRATYQSSQPPAAEKGAPLAARVSDWTIADVLDGAATVGKTVQLVTFVPTDPDAAAPPCAQLPVKGKSAVLLLRSVKNCTFEQRKDIAQDQAGDYIIVARIDEADASKDAIDELKRRIATVRKAQAAFNEKDATLQAQTLANAQDDVEGDQADAALLDLGPQAVPIILDLAKKTDGAGKKRLLRTAATLSPPPADTERPSDAP